jgi:SRSO17 transposase
MKRPRVAGLNSNRVARLSDAAIQCRIPTAIHTIGEPEPTKYWLSTLPDATAVEHLVHVAKMRWRIERDYKDLKQEFGLGQFEGRGWRGFHHHASLCIAAYGFLVAQRLNEGSKKNSEIRSAPALPTDYIPRGSPANAATRT